MTPERTHSSAQRLEAIPRVDLQQQLEDERRARQQAVAYANRLSGVLAAQRASADLDQLLPRLLGIFIEQVAASAGVLWLRADDALILGSLLGAAADADATATVALAESLGVESKPTASPGILAFAGDHALCRCLQLDGPVLGLPLYVDGDLLGVVCLGSTEPHTLEDGARDYLLKLAEHAVSALEEQRAHDDLLRSLTSRDEILGIVAHDLRNPLNVIAAASGSLHKRFPDPLSRRPVERILRAAQRAEHLICDLLDINAIESGHFSIEKQLLDTASTVLTAVESQQGLAASSSVILATDLSPDLPAIDGDEERMLEVFENLLGNAVKFTPAGGTVTVGASVRDGELVIWVKDTGPGISTEQLSRLFDRFWQGKKRDRRGAGLGLTICRAIVEAHGGRIWAESELGAGTTLFFTVPTQSPTPRRHGTDVANILLVDDRPENLLSLKVILDRPDYHLITATSGEEALSLALRETFTLALIDIAMPTMDGFEVAIHMKELARSRDIPIIFITAFGDDPHEIHKAYSAGGADYLVKPLDAEIVRKKVAVFVDLSRRRSEGARPAKAFGEE